MDQTTQEEAGAKPRRQTAKQVEKLLRDYFDAGSRHDLEAMRSFYADDVVLDLVPVGVFRGADAYVQFFGEIFSAVPDIQIVVKRVTANSSMGAVEWRMTGTFDGGPFQGIEANGKPIDLRGCDVFEVRDGKIVQNTAFYDGMEFARAVGLLPAQDSGAERAMKSAFNAVTKLRQKVEEVRS